MNKIVILNSKQCQFITDDNYLLTRLRNHLSFKLNGVEYTLAYKNGWSGITYLLNKNNVFNYGLLNNVKKFLSNNAADFIIQDRRTLPSKNEELDISKSLEKFDLIPREHQLRIVSTACSTDRGIIRAATGSGKTLCTALITAKINKPTIIYVIGIDLLDQFHKLFSKLFAEPIGFIGNGICNVERINIASIWTIGRALKLKNIVEDEEEDNEKELDDNGKLKAIKLLQNTKVHIFDESHVVATQTILEIYKNINAEYIYGFSGTPFRDDNSDLLINSILGDQIINVSASELIKKNLLVPPVIKFYSVPKIKTGHTYPAVYKEYIVENEDRNNLIVKMAKELVDKRYTPLVLFKQIKHGEILLEKISNIGIRCAMLYGNDSLSKRNEIKNAIITKKIDLIIASTIFDLGLDLPELSALILASGGKSSIRALQRIGRVIRIAPGKKIAAVVDFVDDAPHLRKHSQARYKIYASEEGFKVKWPEKKI